MQKVLYLNEISISLQIYPYLYSKTSNSPNFHIDQRKLSLLVFLDINKQKCVGSHCELQTIIQTRCEVHGVQVMERAVVVLSHV